MRLIKENTVKYQPFSKTLQYYTRSTGSNGDLKLINFDSFNNKPALSEKYNLFVQNLYDFHNEIYGLKDAQEIHSKFVELVKKIITTKEADLFFFDEAKRSLIPVNSKISNAQNNLVNKALKNGLLDWIFETGKPTLIPDLDTYTANRVKLCQMIFPLNYNGDKIGVLSLLGSSYKISEDSTENKSVQILLGIIIPVLLTLKQKNVISKLYNELQLYQSKLNNDFGLYAVGEYAEGIIQDMLNSMQIILSNVDFIESESNDVDPEIIEQIKKRIGNLSDLSRRLLKFNEVAAPQTKENLPCELNSIINEFYGIIKSTLKNLELECELDLEEGIPPVLGNPKHIKQILTNVFSLIKKKARSGSGIVLQTRYINETILLSFFITDYWDGFNSSSDSLSALTIKIIKELVGKHEGRAEFESSQLKGTVMHLMFPLKRMLEK